MSKCVSPECKTQLYPGNIHKYCTKCRVIKSNKDIQKEHEDASWSSLLKIPPISINRSPNSDSIAGHNKIRCIIGLSRMHNRTIQVYPLDGSIQPDKDASIELYVPLKEYGVCLVVRK